MNRCSAPLHRTVALCCLLTGLTATASTHASELYRWVEADGSITFSPTPPDGIDYEQIDTAGTSDNAATTLSSSPAPATVTGPALPDELPAQPLDSRPARPVADPVSEDVDGLSYAPPPLGAAMDVDEGIVPGDSLPSIDAAPVADSTSATEATSGNPASVRRERCRELAKRVVSLERRLGTKLSPEDMDNTVLYMARYQASVDQHCKS